MLRLEWRLNSLVHRRSQRKLQERSQEELDYHAAIRRTYELLLEWCWQDPEDREKDHLNRVVHGKPINQHIEDTIVKELGYMPIRNFSEWDRFPFGLVLNR